ncbi:hypothetical protein BKA70DRAFT_1088986 [Coprinopsis sp. MPI-PUGE-AT-0042]|nr:hypothetical protein BKA70DRAFT_1088986 [Coprinopsis sp. MPI-PUGE-AT-0042]
MAAPNTNTAKLTSLLQTTPYTLAFSLPLLLLSTVLVFAGTFLTLDRTRRFAPKQEPGYKAIDGLFEVKPKKRRFPKWYLEGGVGGLIIGYAFGVHLSTLLALVIPGTTALAPLSSTSFLAVWILSCIPTTVLGGRYRLAALVFSGLSGGILIALALSIILHPSLLPRLILLGVFSVLLTVLLLVSFFIPRLSPTLLHPVLRVCTSGIGSFGLVVAIALLSNPKIDNWANAAERFWIPNGEDWGTSKEKALSAAWGILWAVGMASDWGLRRYFGECPDEKWDDYLLNYVSELPNNSGNRAGTFQPLTSFWDKLFKPQHKAYDLYDINVATRSKKGEGDDMVFPSDSDMKIGPSPFNVQPYLPQHSPSSGKLQRKSSTAKPPLYDDIPVTPGFLKKSRSRKSTPPTTRGRKPIKFGAIDEFSSDEEDSDPTKKKASSPDLKGAKSLQGTKANRPLLVTNHPPSYTSYASNASTGSTATLVAPPVFARKVSEHAVIEGMEGDEPFIGHKGELVIDYDKELEKLKKARGDKFGKDVGEDYSDREEDVTNAPPTRSSPPPVTNSQWSPAFLQRHQQGSISSAGKGSMGGTPPTAMPIPATPSLIRAVDRIQRAQHEIYTPLGEAGRPRVSSAVRAERDDLHLEDGIVDHEERRQDENKPAKSPRWEDFWREVRVKAQS